MRGANCDIDKPKRTLTPSSEDAGELLVKFKEDIELSSTSTALGSG